jgi:hypothetical protein
LQGSAARQGDGLARAVHGVEEIDRELVMKVRAGPPPRLLGGAPQQIRKQIVAFCEVPVSRMTLVRVPALARVFAIVARMRRRLFSA